MKEQLHPVVEAYAEGRTAFFEALHVNREGRDRDVVNAIVLLARALKTKQPYDEVLKTVESVDIRNCDHNLLAIFYQYRAHLSLALDRLAEASMLCDRVTELTGPDTPAALVAANLHIAAAAALRVGRKDQAVELNRRALAVLPRSSPRFPMLYSDLACFQANVETFAEIEEEYREVVRNPRYDDMLDWREVIYLIHYVKTGQIEKVATIDRARLAKLPPETVAETERLLTTAELLAGRPREPLPPCFAAIRELLAGRPEPALSAAREDVKTNTGFLYGTDFQDFNLVRCELATRRAGAARRLLRLRRERGNTHHLDDFFLARAELLDGDFGEAARLFSAAYRACERYRSLPRLDIEVRMACELSAADAMRLTRAALTAAPAGLRPGPEASAAVPAPPPQPPSEQPSGSARLLGPSGAMAAVREAIGRAAKLDVPVLITGETGTGKELVARAIHEDGPRAGEPFIAVNCGALTDSLLESELFGYERGAFTGADKAHQGFFETAGAGTVFLDEIGDISPRLQVAMLRVLETGEIRRVGSSTSQRVSCRILAATNTSPERLADPGRFRQDLLYRLRRLEIVLPPLRERREDILALAGHFLAEGRADGARPVMSPELRSALAAYLWPGNVRELRNEVERMRLMNSDQPAYDLGHLDGRIAAGVPDPAGRAVPAPAEAGAAAAPAGPAGRGLQRGRSPMRQLEELRDLFRGHRSLTRAEAAVTLGVSPNTATKYLQQLTAEGFVRRIEPNASPRTHYFELAPGPADVDDAGHG